MNIEVFIVEQGERVESAATKVVSGEIFATDEERENHTIAINVYSTSY